MSGTIGESMTKKKVKYTDVKTMTISALCKEWESNDMNDIETEQRLLVLSAEIRSRHPFNILFDEMDDLKEQFNAMRKFLDDVGLVYPQDVGIKDVTSEVY